MSKFTKNTTVINLRIHRETPVMGHCYDVIHVGVFPNTAVTAIVASLNISGIAYESAVGGQTGHVELVTAARLSEGDFGAEVVRKSSYYQPLANLLRDLAEIEAERSEMLKAA